MVPRLLEQGLTLWDTHFQSAKPTLPKTNTIAKKFATTMHPRLASQRGFALELRETAVLHQNEVRASPATGGVFLAQADNPLRLALRTKH